MHAKIEDEKWVVCGELKRSDLDQIAIFIRHNQENIPKPQHSGAFNPSYVTHIIQLHVDYQDLCEKYEALKLEQPEEVQTFQSELDLITQEQQKLLTKGLTTVLMFSEQVENLEAVMARLKAYAPAQGIEIFRFLIARDRAEPVQFLLNHMNVSVHETTLPAKKSDALHGAASLNTIHEEMVAKSATKCLAAVVEMNQKDQAPAVEDNVDRSTCVMC